MSEGSSGWAKAVAGSVLGVLVAVGGLWLARHDTDVKANAARDAELADLVEFKRGLQRRIEDAKADHQQYAADIAALKAQIMQSSRERRAIYRWMEQVSVKLNVAPPVLPDQGGGAGGASGGER